MHSKSVFPHNSKNKVKEQNAAQIIIVMHADYNFYNILETLSLENQSFKHCRADNPLLSCVAVIKPQFWRHLGVYRSYELKSPAKI